MQLRYRRVCLFIQHDKIETETFNYKVSEKAIKDKGLLGTRSQELCDNLDVYWMTASCDAESDERKFHSWPTKQLEGKRDNLWKSPNLAPNEVTDKAYK